MQAHLGAHMLEGLRQEVRRAHPVFQRAKDMFHRAPAQRHRIGLVVQSLLHSVQDTFVLPAFDAPVTGGRALTFDRAARTGTGPVGAQGEVVLDRIKAVDGTLPGGAPVFVVLRDVDEVGLVEPPLGLGIGGLRLGHEGRDARVFASFDLRAAEVPAVGKGLQLLGGHGLACSPGQSLPMLVTSCATIR